MGVAGVLVGGLVAALLRVKGGGLAIGDAKLAILIGLICGWPAVLYAIVYGVFLAGIPSVVMTFSGKGRRHFSYGPYLAIGCMVVLLFPGRFV